ncbi:MAG: OmpA family protein [Tenacibaculum sp.]|nr:OmpA family protein [Tenacibaculum sp.]
MYFTRDNYNKGKKRKSKDKIVKLKLYKAIRNSNVEGWHSIEELPFNSDEYSVGHPALSSDEKTLYFTSDMPGGYGKTDIYKVAIYSDDKYGVSNNKYGVPENLGSVINTEGREMFPYMSKNNILYFSSDGHSGLGGLDIFESKLNELGDFKEIISLKRPFNSKLDDFGFCIDSKDEFGFFSSNRSGGKGDDDIYSFVLNRKKQDCLQTVSGFVTDSNTGKILPNSTVKLIDLEGRILQVVKSDLRGSYRFEVSCDTNYKVLASYPDYRSNYNSLKTTLNSEFKNSLDLELSPLIVGNEIKIKPIYFDFNKSYIREDAKYELENIVTVMNNHSDIKLRIESHTDSRGNNDYNRKLSDRRAKSTRDYLIYRGIPNDRILSAIGYGEDRLLNGCDDENECSEKEHQLNRRSYFFIER